MTRAIDKEALSEIERIVGRGCSVSVRPHATTPGLVLTVRVVTARDAKKLEFNRVFIAEEWDRHCPLQDFAWEVKAKFDELLVDYDAETLARQRDGFKEMFV